MHDLPGILDVSYMGSKVHVIVRPVSKGGPRFKILTSQSDADATIQEVLPTMEDIFWDWRKAGWNDGICHKYRELTRRFGDFTAVGQPDHGYHSW